MQYAIEVVGDDDLPQGVHKVVVEREGQQSMLLINGPLAQCWRFMRAYEDTIEPCDVPTILLPATPLLYAV